MAGVETLLELGRDIDLQSLLEHNSNDVFITDQPNDINRMAVIDYLADCSNLDPKVTLTEKSPDLPALVKRYYKAKTIGRHLPELIPFATTAMIQRLKANPFRYLHNAEGITQIRFEFTTKFILNPTFLHSCGGCGSISSHRHWYMPLCGRCKCIRYCDQECFQHFWPTHKRYCKRCRKHPQAESDRARNVKSRDKPVLVEEALRQQLNSVMVAMFFNLKHLIDCIDLEYRLKYLHPDATVEFNFDSPFFEVTSANECQTGLIFRPISMNSYIKRLWPHMSSKDWKETMTKPYRAIVLLMWLNGNKVDGSNEISLKGLMIPVLANIKKITSLCDKERFKCMQGENGPSD